jgi:diaminopimelate decarboxylase
LFAYDLARFGENGRALQDAMAQTGLPFRLRLALKANPLPEVLAVFRGLGEPGTPESVSIDACSPGEVLRALECGWRPDEISYTGNVSERDLDVLVAPGIPTAASTRSARSSGMAGAPPTRIGIRIDPGGCRPNRISNTALADQVRSGSSGEGWRPRIATTSVDTIHFHAGSGWLAGGSAHSNGRCRPRSGSRAHTRRRADIRGQRGWRARVRPRRETGVDPRPTPRSSRATSARSA